MRSTLAFVGVFLSQVAFAQLDFHTQVDIPLDQGWQGTNAKFGDIDGDGDNDVVFTAFNKSALYVWYNENSKFPRIETLTAPLIAPPSEQDNTRGPGAFTLHDMNGDGMKDIVATNYDDYLIDHISIFSFASGKPMVIDTIEIAQRGVGVSVVHCTDLNKDGKPDIVLSLNYGGKFLIELESKPGGGYIEKKINTPEIDGNRSQMVDVDGDGNLDLVVTTQDPKIMIYKGSAEGTFAFDRSLTATNIAFDIVIADFTGDQRTDIISLSGVDPGIFDFFVQQSDGSFTKQNINPIDETIFTMAGGDIDNDGDMDFAYAVKYVTDMVLMINDGTGNFTTELVSTNNDSFHDVQFADIDGDHFPEILPSSFIGHVEILKKTAGEYKSYTYFQYYVKAAEYITLADLNNDDRLDITLFMRNAPTVSVAFNSGDERLFEHPNLYDIPLKPTRTRAFRVNDDEYKDIVYSTVDFDGQGPFGATSGLSAFIRDANGEYTLTELDPPTSYSPLDIDPGDFNNDGHTDMQSSYFALYGNSTGEFVASQIPNIAIYLQAQAVADFNDDGFDDMILANETTIMVRWGQAQSSMLDGPGQPADDVRHMTVANLNKDNFPDVVTLNDDGQLRLLIGNGDGTFVTKSPLMHGALRWYTDAAYYAVADFDADGDDDIAIHWIGEIFEPNRLLTYLNDGTGTAFHLVDIELPNTLDGPIVAGKIDGDEFPDIIFNRFEKSPAILLSDMVIEPGEAPSSVVPSEETSISVTITFTGGSGDGRLLIIREGQATNAVPRDSIFYDADPMMGHGDKIGADNYVVYAGDGTSAVVTGLKPNTTYYFALFESDQNEKNTIINYLTTSLATGSFSTKATQVITFTVPDKTMGDADFSLNATSSSGLPVTTYQVVSGNVTIAGSKVTINGAGPAVVRAIQEGNDSFDGAFLDESFCVNPRKPTIAVSIDSKGQPTLTSSSNTNNQWDLNGQPILLATGKTYKPTEDGHYRVTVSQGVCFSVSEPTGYITTGLEENIMGIIISPNPVRDRLFVNTDKAVEVLDMTGRIYKTEAIALPDGIELNVGDLPKGIYLLKSEKLVLKFVKE